MNSADELLKHNAQLPSANRFCCPAINPSTIKDVALSKIAGNKVGSGFKLLKNPVNVEHSQSLQHVQPVCEFKAPDTRNNLQAAIFHDGNPCKLDFVDILHCRCVFAPS